MSAAAPAVLSMADLFDMFLRFLSLSLLSIGGAISTAPEMHRYLVVAKGWLSDTQFTSSIALAQAAPGPNILFVAVLGWNTAGWAGTLAAMLGIMLPSTTLVMAATRWAEANRNSLVVRSFTSGMAPLTLGLLSATGWLLALPYVADPAHRWTTLALMAVTVLVVVRTRLSLLWLVAGGGVLGALGWV